MDRITNSAVIVQGFRKYDGNISLPIIRTSTIVQDSKKQALVFRKQHTFETFALLQVPLMDR